MFCDDHRPLRSNRSLILLLILLGPVMLLSPPSTYAESAPVAEVTAPAGTPSLELTGVAVRYLKDLELLVFEQQLKGSAGATVPAPRGQMHGAPVLGYVFPTTLSSTDVGFGEVEGGVALAVTSHPDFDDTPLWDEDGDRVYDNDGQVFHTHWVVLGKDERVPGGLSVIEHGKDSKPVMPPTNPGMPMYMDSPGFSVVLDGNRLKVLVPAARAGGVRDFRYDGVTAYMEVNTEDEGRPLLGVYAVYGVVSGDLSLPFEVR